MKMGQPPHGQATQGCRSLGRAQDLDLSLLSSHPLQKRIILTCLQMSWSVIPRRTIRLWAPMIRGPLSACPRGALRSWAHPQAGTGTATPRESCSTPSTSPLTRYGRGMGGVRNRDWDRVEDGDGDREGDRERDREWKRDEHRDRSWDEDRDGLQTRTGTAMGMGTGSGTKMQTGVTARDKHPHKPPEQGLQGLWGAVGAQPTPLLAGAPRASPDPSLPRCHRAAAMSGPAAAPARTAGSWPGTAPCHRQRTARRRR